MKSRWIKKQYIYKFYSKHHSSLFNYTYIFINYYGINIDLKRFVQNDKLGFSGVKTVIYSPILN